MARVARVESFAPDEIATVDVMNRVVRRCFLMGKSVFEADLGTRSPFPYGVWHLEAMDSHGGWLASAIDLAKLAAALDRPVS